MNFHDKKIIPPKYIYLFMAFVCFLLLFFSVIFESRISVLKAVTSTVITPMQSGINEIGTSLFTGVSNRKEKAALLEENKKLRNKISEYSSQIKQYEQENYELKRLQELLNLKEQYPDYNTIGARVIATDSTNWFYTFIIDKGSENGVKVGCNILANGGLAGIVTEVGTNYAKVRAIIDDNSNVSATVSGSKTLCTVSGDLSLLKEGYINVGYINKADDIEEGSELVTSHVSDKFLPGLLIGYISDVQMDANNLTKSAKCIPVVDFHNLQEVLVVLDLKADYHTDSENKNIYDSIQNKEDVSKDINDNNSNSSEEENDDTSENTETSNTETSNTDNGISEESSADNNQDAENEDQDENGQGEDSQTITSESNNGD